MSETETATSPLSPARSDADRLDGYEAIAKYLGRTVRQAKYGRETGSLPIRKNRAIGIYAFKPELDAALLADETLHRPRTS